MKALAVAHYVLMIDTSGYPLGTIVRDRFWGARERYDVNIGTVTIEIGSEIKVYC